MAPEGFGVTGNFGVIQHFVDSLGDFDNFAKGDVFGIEIDHAPIGFIQRTNFGVPRIELNGAQINQKHERIYVVAQHIVQVALFAVRMNDFGGYPIRGLIEILLEETVSGDAARKPVERLRPTFQVWQQGFSDRTVIIGQLSLGEL